MAVQLDHTIVWCRDKQVSSVFMADILGLPKPSAFLHFMVVPLANGVSMDFMEKEGPISPQHYAFLVSDAEFDAGMDRIAERDLPFWADPGKSRAGEINRRRDGRGVYFEDPDGHLLELMTKPYATEKEA